MSEGDSATVQLRNILARADHRYQRALVKMAGNGVPPFYTCREELRTWRDEWHTAMKQEHFLLLTGRHPRQIEFYRHGNAFADRSRFGEVPTNHADVNQEENTDG